MLSATSLSLSLGRSQVLTDVSADFRPGRFTALMGANGCGKSTLLRCLMGILAPQAGQVLLQGTPIARMSRRQIARQIAYMPQINHCPDHLTVGELVELAGYSRTGLFGAISDADRGRFREALVTVGLDGAEARRVNHLSGGMRQRAFIAMVLAQDAPILLMDEPVNHLDLKYQYGVLDLIRRLVLAGGKTVIVVLHDLNLALGYADDAVLLSDGRVLGQGPAREVLNSAAIARGFGIDADLHHFGDRLVCLPKGTQMVGQP